MEKHLEALWRQEISFDSFEAHTARHWDRIAMSLWRRWCRSIPPSVTVDEIRQELLLHAWQAVGSFDPSRGATLKKYVVFNACSKAMRYIHTQRDAKRRSDHSESRHAVAFSTIRETDDWVDAVMSETLDIEEMIDARKLFERALQETEGLRNAALRAVDMAGGDVRLAGVLLYDALTPTWRVKNQWSESNAARCIEESLRSVSMA